MNSKIPLSLQPYFFENLCSIKGAIQSIKRKACPRIFSMSLEYVRRWFKYFIGVYTNMIKKIVQFITPQETIERADKIAKRSQILFRILKAVIFILLVIIYGYVVGLRHTLLSQVVFAMILVMYLIEAYQNKLRRRSS
jgi:hypothetical protein